MLTKIQNNDRLTLEKFIKFSGIKAENYFINLVKLFLSNQKNINSKLSNISLNKVITEKLKIVL